MHHFFVTPQQISGDKIRIEGGDVNHMKNVLRMKLHEKAEISDGESRTYLCEVEAYEEDAAVLHILEEMEADTEPASKLYLFQGLPKSDKMELIVQKSTELGAAAIAPVAMIRSVVKLEGKDAAKKTERWQKIAREAVKQCARVSAPEVRLPRKLSAMREELNALDVLIVPWEDARGYSLTAFHREHPDIRDLAIVIGPEGGMSADEIARMKDCGCQSVTLGPRILRTETAGLCALSALFCLYGELE